MTLYFIEFNGSVFMSKLFFRFLTNILMKIFRKLGIKIKNIKMNLLLINCNVFQAKKQTFVSCKVYANKSHQKHF